MERETTELEIKGITFHIYTEPIYDDELYIERERVQLDVSVGPENKPQLKGHKIINTHLLRLERAIESWSLDQPVSRESVSALPLSVARALNQHLDNTEWAGLGEAPGPRGGTVN